MKEFTEEARYEYDLTPDSWVIDIGAHKGEFSRKIGQKYNCNILGFEPIREFWTQAYEDQTYKTTMLNMGVGNKFKVISYNIQGDSTGEWSTSDRPELVSIIPADALILGIGSDEVDLLKINAEGAEYEILEHLLTWCNIHQYKNIQVQFHGVIRDSKNVRRKIAEDLEDSHHQTWIENDVNWENWERND